VTIIILSSQEVASSIYALADGSLSDWFGGFLFSAGQQANEAVQDQLSSLSFTRSPINSYTLFSSIFPQNWKYGLIVCLLFIYVYSLAVIYGAGLVTSLSPCTLSVLPLTLGYIGEHAAVGIFSISVSFTGLSLLFGNISGAFGSGKSRAEVITNLYYIILLSFYDHV